MEELEKIQERNARVEADKAWETSYTRMCIIAGGTYVVVAATLLTIGVEQPFVTAFIPSIGFILSAQSLPAIKRWWLRTLYKSEINDL